MGKFEFSKSSLAELKTVDPRVASIFKAALKVSPIDFGIPKDGGYRTAERQNEMYLDKDIATNCDGYKVISKHQSGMAVDVYAYVNGKASWEPHHLAMVAGVILATNQIMIDTGLSNIQLTWGGTFGSNDFNGWDKPHFEGRVIKSAE